MSPNNKLLDLLRIDLPIIQAPMAGFATVELAAACPRRAASAHWVYQCLPPTQSGRWYSNTVL
jgi:NAD(P)H-dependent flavin oxidoreductase YrpB (nitropropane dioxygenase family)